MIISLGGREDLLADNRTPFRREFVVQGQDLSGATYAGEIRLYGNASGAALASMSFSVVTVATENYGNTSGSVSRFVASISEGDMEGLPTADELGSDRVFSYDIQQTFNTQKSVFCHGDFRVRAGVTSA